MELQLFVRNAKDEYVTTLLPTHPGRQGPPGAVTLPAKLIVADYTRDQAILGSHDTFSLTSVRDQPKLATFRTYLSQRQKAGIVGVPDGKLYLLPPQPSDPPDSIVCTRWVDLFAPIQPEGSPPAPTPTPAASGSPLPVTQQASASHPPAPLQPPRPAAQSWATPAPGPVSALSAQQKAANELLDFRTKVREDIASFLGNEDRTALHLPPLDKTQRYIIEDEAADHEDALVVRTEEEGEDRHMVLYKLGSEPVEDEGLSVEKQHVQVRGPSKSASTVRAPPPPSLVSRPEDLKVLNTVKRDRRSIQEIQRDMQEGKRYKPS